MSTAVTNVDTLGHPSRTLAIVGPTAVGKSELADLVAWQLRSSVISVDAMQVYRGMDIGTAKMPLEDRRVPLLMVDVADVDENYSVQRFQSDARVCADELLDAGKVPVFCGGTGLYLDAVIDEMSFPAGKTGDSQRSVYEARAEHEGAQSVWELLHERDAASAALIHPNNVRRVIRALEMADSGISYAEQSAGLHVHKAHYDCQIWALECDRATLHARIEQRVSEMFASGLVDEVQALLARGLGAALTARQAIGYAQVIDYLEGRCSLAEAKEAVVVKTRQYAKRQLSWFRRDARVTWLSRDLMSLDDLCERILAEFGKGV